MNRTVPTALLALMLLTAVTAFAAEVPYLSGRVNDNAEILSAAARSSLTEQLKAHEERTGNQVAVLTIATLGGESIEEYAVQVFEAWKLGQRDRDNGVLVLVAHGDRRMRIEVGYGLEGSLTDLLAGRIIRSVMTPRFKEGDFDGGVAAGVAAIIDVLEQGGSSALAQEPANEAPEASRYSLESPDMPVVMRILVGAFVFGIIGLFTFMGIVTPGAGWFLYFFLIPFWAMFPIVVVGSTGALILLVLYVIGFPIAKLSLRKKPWYKKAKEDLKKKGRASIGGFSISSGGSGGGWSSGGGGFSGGGGSSGGGGASGGW